MFQEVQFSHPNLPGIGAISGPVDYVSAVLRQDIPLLVITGGVAAPDKPFSFWLRRSVHNLSMIAPLMHG